MKKYIITALFTASILLANAQTPKLNYQSKGNNVIALNPGVVVGNIWYPISNSPNEYLITYRRIFANANAVRLGINGNTNNYNQEKNDTILSTYKTTNYKIGLGYERYIALTKAWNLYVGADGQYGSTNATNETPSSTYIINQKSTTTNKALMGFIGVMVNLNSRIAIGLESGYKKEYSFSTTISNEKINGVFTEITSTNDNNATTYISPQLQLRVKF